MNFEGEIGEMDLIQRLVDLGRERFTGAIRFEQDGIIKIVYFKGGDVLSASTNDRTDAVDEILLRAGKVSKDHVKQALSKRKENESLGDALLNLGFITRKELTWGRRIQVIGILRSVRTWDHGSYAIVADYLPKREEGTLFPLQQILIELFVTEQDRQPFERALDGGSAVLTKIEGFDEAFSRLGLNEEAAEIASKIDGTTTAAEIAAATGKDVFNTYKLLEALRALGLLRKEEKPQAKDELAFESVGVADAADAWSSGKMPAFELEPEPPVEPLGEEAPPPPTAIAIPNPPEVQWGFDEAQIETAKKATAPPPKPAARVSQTQSRRTPPQFTRTPEKKQRGAPVFALIVLLIIAAAAFAGWYWWKGQSASLSGVAIFSARKPRASVPAAHKAPTPPPTTTTFAAVVPPTTSSGGQASPAVQPNPMLSGGGRPSPAVQPRPPLSSGGQPPPAVQPRPTLSGGGQPPASVKPSTMPEQPPMAPASIPRVAKFTIQIELVCQDSSLRKAEQMGGANVWSAPISYRGQQCHRVFWGRYENRAEAEATTAQVPAALRVSKPVVVTIPQP